MKFSEFQFNARIFISFTIVAVVALLAFGVLPSQPALCSAFGVAAGWGWHGAWIIGCIAAMLLLAVASFLRIWAGGVLTAQRMMAFPVQTDAFICSGPYRMTRNPIYLADLIAMSAFAIMLPPIGVLLPVLFALHYRGLIRYEEAKLLAAFGSAFAIYCWKVPRLLPSVRGLRPRMTKALRHELTVKGWRHNSLYLLFIPGFVVATYTHQLWNAVLIGLPAVIDWAVVHTKLGLGANCVSTRRGRRPKVLRDILYAQCWEDPEMDRQAFNIGPDHVVFCITSGGCNALTFLLDNPSKVIALDVNPFQTYLLDLKLAAFARLEYGEMLELMGVRDSKRRPALYGKLRPALRTDSRRYWDQQERKIKKGIIHCGRFEAYLRLLRAAVRTLIGHKAVTDLYRADTQSERLHVYRHQWCTRRWKLFTRLLLSRRVMSLLFDKAFFAYLDKSLSFGEHFEGKIKRALTQLPLKKNWFLSYMLLGRYYDEHNLPPYLRRGNFETICSRLDRIELVTADCTAYFAGQADNNIDSFNFTNIFEWMSPYAFESLLRETVRVGRAGAILTYRNLLVTRERPPSLAHCIREKWALASWLHAQDLSFIYDHYLVEEIHKDSASCPMPSQLYEATAQ